MKNITLTVLLIAFSLVSKCTWSNEYLFLTEHYPPYVYMEDETLNGVSVQFLNEALEQAKINTPITLYPFARTIRLAQNNDPLIAFPVMKSEKRSEFFNWIGPIAKGEFWLYKLRDREHLELKSLEDAKFYSIGTVRGGRAAEFFESKGFENLVEVTDIEQGINMLIRSNIDLITVERAAAIYLTKSLGVEYSTLEPIIEIDQMSQHAYLAASKSAPQAVVNSLRSIIETMHSAGRYEEIERDYLKRLLE